MTADIELLPLPEYLYGREASDNERVVTVANAHAYAIRNVAHATAAKDAEIERLRALLLEACDDGDEADADLLATLERARTSEARAERLAEALRGMMDEYEALHAEYDLGDCQATVDARAALREHEQEVGNG